MKHGDSMMVPESWTGPGYHIAVVVDSLLCGLVGKIVARLEENCKRLLDGEFDRAGAGCGLCDII